VVNIPFYGLIFVFSPYFQKINGLSPLETGLAFVPMMGAVLPAGTLLSAASCLALLGIECGTKLGTMRAIDRHGLRHSVFGAANDLGITRQRGKITLRRRGKLAGCSASHSLARLSGKRAISHLCWAATRHRSAVKMNPRPFGGLCSLQGNAFVRDGPATFEAATQSQDRTLSG
jgi:hypothetical protein